MERLLSFRDADGEYRVPESEAEAFRREAPEARAVLEFRDAEGEYRVPEDELEAFRAAAPQAEPVRRVRTAAGDFAVPESERGDFMREYRSDPDFEPDRAAARVAAEAAAGAPESAAGAAARGAGRGALAGANDAAAQIFGGVADIPVIVTKAAAYAAGGDTTAAGRFLGRSAEAGERLMEGAPWNQRPPEVQGAESGLPGQMARSAFTQLVPAALTGGASTFVSPLAHAGSRGFEAYRAAKEAGKDEAEAQRLGAVAAAVEGVPEAVSSLVGGGRVVREAVGAGNRAARLARGMVAALAPASIEAGTEFVQEGGGALVDQAAAGRGFDAREALAAGVQGAAVAALTMGAIEGGQTVLTARDARRAASSARPAAAVGTAPVAPDANPEGAALAALRAPAAGVPAAPLATDNGDGTQTLRMAPAAPAAGVPTLPPPRPDWITAPAVPRGTAPEGGVPSVPEGAAVSTFTAAPRDARFDGMGVAEEARARAGWPVAPGQRVFLVTMPDGRKYKSPVPAQIVQILDGVTARVAFTPKGGGSQVLRDIPIARLQEPSNRAALRGRAQALAAMPKEERQAVVRDERALRELLRQQNTVWDGGEEARLAAMPYGRDRTQAEGAYLRWQMERMAERAGVADFDAADPVSRARLLPLAREVVASAKAEADTAGARAAQYAPPQEVSTATLEEGDMVWTDGEWHTVRRTEDGVATQLVDGYAKTYETGEAAVVQGVLRPGEDGYDLAREQYRLQEAEKNAAAEVEADGPDLEVVEEAPEGAEGAARATVAIGEGPFSNWWEDTVKAAGDLTGVDTGRLELKWAPVSGNRAVGLVTYDGQIVGRVTESGELFAVVEDGSETGALRPVASIREMISAQSTPDSPTLSLESQTPADVDAERERIAAQQQAQAERDEIARRAAAPIAGTAGDVAQPGLPGVEGVVEENLFNRAPEARATENPFELPDKELIQLAAKTSSGRAVIAKMKTEKLINRKGEFAEGGVIYHNPETQETRRSKAGRDTFEFRMTYHLDELREAMNRNSEPAAGPQSPADLRAEYLSATGLKATKRTQQDAELWNSMGRPTDQRSEAFKAFWAARSAPTIDLQEQARAARTRGAVATPDKGLQRTIDEVKAWGRRMFDPERGVPKQVYQAWQDYRNSLEAAKLLGREERQQRRDIIGELEAAHGRAAVTDALRMFDDGALTADQFAMRFGLAADADVMNRLRTLEEQKNRREAVLAGWEGLPEPLRKWIAGNLKYQSRRYLRFALGQAYQPTPQAYQDAVHEIGAGIGEAVARLEKSAGRLAGRQARTRLDVVRWMETGDPAMLAHLSPARRKAAAAVRERYLGLRRVIDRLAFDGQTVTADVNADALRLAAEDWVDYYLERESPGVGSRGGVEIGGFLKRHLDGAFRALYGEITDPAERQGITAETQARMLAGMTFWRRVLAEGEGTVWARAPDMARRLTERLGDPNNATDRKRYGNMAGRYVTPEFLALVGGGERNAGAVHKTMRAIWFGPMSFQRGMKLLAPKTIARNYITAVGFATQAGDIFLKGWAPAYARAHKLVGRFLRNDAGAIAEVRRMHELGVFNAGANSTVEDLRQSLGGLAAKPGGAGQKAMRAYAYIDFFTKYAAFQARVQSGMTEAQAAEHVQRCYQSRYRTPEIFSRISKSGLGRDYISYTYDSARMAVNAARFGVESARKGDMGPLLGFILARGIWAVALGAKMAGMAAIGRALIKLGGDDDDEAPEGGEWAVGGDAELGALRSLVPQYDQDGPLMLMTHTKPDGSKTRHYVVLGGQTGFPLEDRIMGALQSPERGGSFLGAAARAFADTVVGPGMQVNAIVRTVAGRDFQGKQTPTGKGLVDAWPGKVEPERARVLVDAAIGLAMDYMPEYPVKMLRDLWRRNVREEAGRQEVGIFARHERDALDIVIGAHRLLRGYRIERSDANNMLRGAVADHIDGLRELSFAITAAASAPYRGGVLPDQLDRAERAQDMRADYLREIADRCRDARAFAPEWFDAWGLDTVLDKAGMAEQDRMAVHNLIDNPDSDWLLRKQAMPTLDWRDTATYQQLMK